nr:RNA-directed DNA polymerase, eukaryota [Tanacetum cinerariifolium]
MKLSKDLDSVDVTHTDTYKITFNHRPNNPPDARPRPQGNIAHFHMEDVDYEYARPQSFQRAPPWEPPPSAPLMSSERDEVRSAGSMCSLVSEFLSCIVRDIVLCFAFYRLDQNKDCLLIDRIENGQWKWKWNWSRTNIGVHNTAYLRDLLTEISLIDINVDEDSCVWSIAKDDIFMVGETRRIITSMLLPSLVPPTS